MEEMKINISDNLANQRARAIYDKLICKSKFCGCFKCRESIVADTNLIATALADERRRVLDEIGDQLDQLGDWYFNEGNTQARLAVEKVEQFLNEYDKAHAGQEG